jgi:large-conductance mechanosensitive channel
LGILEFITAVILFTFVPAVVFTFVYKVKKHEEDTKKLQIQKEILELEVEKQRDHLKLLEEENKKLDRVIDGR